MCVWGESGEGEGAGEKGKERLTFIVEFFEVVDFVLVLIVAVMAWASLLSRTWSVESFENALNPHVTLP